MPSFGSPYRDSSYREFYLDSYFPVQFLVYLDGSPVDLTAYDSVKLMIYDTPDDVSLRDTISLSVDATLTGGVQATCSGNVALTGLEGDIYCKLIGVLGAQFHLLGAPWKASVYASGPTS